MKYVLLMLLCLPLSLPGQEISRDVLATQGDFSESRDMTLSWTLGQTFTETVSTMDRALTAGYQQPDFQIREVQLPEAEILQVELFPNPTPGMLNLKVTQAEIEAYTVEIIDQAGRLMSTVNRNELDTQIDMSAYSAGHYFVRITSRADKLFAVFDVIKL